MIVSYSLGFIFIKTKKTAGSTVEAVLAAACAPEDVVTMHAAPGRLWPGSPRIVRNVKPHPDFQTRYSRAVEDGRKRLKDGRSKSDALFRAHLTARQICKRIDPKFWAPACKIVTERHPYERAVSQAYFRLHVKQSPIEDFARFLDRIVRGGGYTTYDRWTIDDKVVVDEFIRHESLRADLERVAKRLGFVVPLELPQLKTTTRLDRRPAREILSDEQKQVIYETCAREFEILGYER